MNGITEKIVDWIVYKWIGAHVSGWQTKLGSVVVFLLSLSAAILVIVQSIRMLQDGNAHEALLNLGSVEMQAAIAGLGLTKIALGLRHAIDKSTAVTVDAAVTAVDEVATIAAAKTLTPEK